MCTLQLLSLGKAAVKSKRHLAREGAHHPGSEPAANPPHSHKHVNALVAMSFVVE